MRNSIRLAFASIKYYKKQTMSLFIGIVLSAALFTGIASLLGSGRTAALENARTEYGDWHYSTRCDAPWFEIFRKNPRGNGFTLEKYGTEIIRKVIEEPFSIQLVSADEGYLEMMGRTLKEGRYPEKANEAAMDIHTLRNLGVSETLGSQVVLDGDTFVLCGIMTQMPEKLDEILGDTMQVFVSSTLDYGTNGSFVYLKFKESQKVYGQIAAFAKVFGIDPDRVARNNGIADFVGGEPTFSSCSELWKEIGGALRNPNMGIPYIWARLNPNGVLMEHMLLGILALFAAFVIYSLFQISVMKRLSHYSVMQTLGMTDARTFATFFTEMLMVFAAGYPAGCLMGNLLGAVIYKQAGQIFITRNTTYHSGISAEDKVSQLSVENLPDAGVFQISKSAVFWGAVFLLLLLAFISLVLVRRMKGLTIRQMMAKDGKGKKSRRIYSLKHGNLTGILTRKFMFARRGAFVGIVLSLSVGSIIFLGAAYVTENTKRNNELTFKADDGLGSDIQVYEASDSLSDTIPEEKEEALKQISGIEEVHCARYMLGEIPLLNGMLKWTSYYPEIANEEGNEPDPVIMEKYNGTIVQTGEQDYLLKVNVYGYDDEMLESLNEYLLDGEINPDKMRKENTVIFKPFMGGQGNYDGIAIQTGDIFEMKTPKDAAVPKEALKFQGDESWYTTSKYQITAMVSRPLLKVDTFIGEKYNSVVDIIMTNEQMEKNFGVKGLQTISISVKEGQDAGEAADQVRRVTKDIPKCIVKDYSGQIRAQNLYLAQKMLFFYGIAAVLLGISLLHIGNSMQYLIAARKQEFSIMRAMGITDGGFLKMLAKEGFRYGIYSGLVIAAVFFVVQKVLYYFMIHVYLYLHPGAWISPAFLVVILGLNFLICIGAVLTSGRELLKLEIMEGMRD